MIDNHSLMELLERWEKGEELEEGLQEEMGQYLLSQLGITNLYLGPCIMANGGFDEETWRTFSRPKLFRDTLMYERMRRERRAKGE